MNKNIKPINNIIKIYSACWECYNGEPYSCNWRNITTNYICTARFGRTLNELLNGLEPITFNKFRQGYIFFCNSADSDQIFNVAGKNIIKDEDKDEDGDDMPWPYVKYEIPPEILSFNEIKENLNLLNN